MPPETDFNPSKELMDAAERILNSCEGLEYFDVIEACAVSAIVVLRNTFDEIEKDDSINPEVKQNAQAFADDIANKFRLAIRQIEFLKQGN